MIDSKDIEILDKLFQSKIDVLTERMQGLKSKFDAEFINVHDTLDRIEKQTTKTNGRVTELEDKNSGHYINCPNTEKVGEIHEDLSEYRMFKKYPKIAIGIVAVACLVLVGGTYLALKDFTEKTTKDLNITIQEEIKQLSK